jgi:hypothetical protein
LIKSTSRTLACELVLGKMESEMPSCSDDHQSNHDTRYPP